MNPDEPVIPPFPMSEYGTGCAGTIAALSLGLYPPELVQELINKFRNARFYGKGEED